MANVVLVCGSCLPFLFTWSFRLDNYQQNMMRWFSSSLLEEQERGKRGREGEKEKERAQAKKNCLSPVVCILFSSVTYSTETDIKTVVTCRYDVHKTKIGQPSDLMVICCCALTWNVCEQQVWLRSAVNMDAKVNSRTQQMLVLCGLVFAHALLTHPVWPAWMIQPEHPTCNSCYRGVFCK